jgi:putative intracellular protease/amidase
METDDHGFDRELGDAVVLYLMWGRSSFPRHDPAAVMARFGNKKGGELIARVDALIGELFAVEVAWSEHTLVSGTDLATSRIRESHPELNEEAIKALGWEFSFAWR